MKIYNLNSILTNLQDGLLFLDNTSLILLLNYREQFSEVLYKLRKENCAFLTIPSVAFEFQRTDSIEGPNLRTTGLYCLHKTKYEKVVTSILSNNV